jgi:hypothetical protein
MGAQCMFLRKVVIDMDARCPFSCDYSSNSQEILPLVRFMWRHLDAKLQIRFGRTGRALSKSLDLWLIDNDTADEDDFDLGSSSSDNGAHEAIDFTGLLDAFGNRDVLNLECTSRFLTSIGVHERDGNGYSYVTYKHSSGPRRIQVSDKGKHLAWEPQRSVRSLESLAPSVQDIICRYAAFAPASVTLDLNTQTAHGLDLSAFQFFRGLRPKNMHRRMWMRPRTTQRHVVLTVKMTSMTGTSGYYHFAQLKLLLNDLAFCDTQTDDFIAGIVQGIYGTEPGQDFSLNFVLKAPQTLENVRINAKGLALILSDRTKTNPEMWSDIRLMVIDREDPEGCKEEQRLSFRG